MLEIIGLLSIGFTVAFTTWAAFADSQHGGQSMRDSIKETWTNIAIGFGINFVANIAVLPLAGFVITASSALWVGAIFTAISVIRSFALRRLFNFFEVRKQATKAA